jgi:upstream activation factor subunit UAF30
VRNQLQEKLHVDLTSRKKELDKLIMECVNAMASEGESSSDESVEEVKPTKKRKAESSDESDYKPTKSSKKRRGSSDDSDEDYSSKKKSSKTNKKGQKYTGFTRPYKLSPDLAKLMGEKELPRHEVVKKVWAIIKEKNLYDPKNKQYAICDAQLEKVIGVKR